MLSAEEIRDLLSELSRAEFAAFVADLWAARGRETRRDGQSIVVRGPNHEEKKTLYAVAEGGDPVPPDGVDAIVTAADPPGDEVPDRVRVIGADELGMMVRYALERDVQRRLLEDYFGGLAIDRTGEELSEPPRPPGNPPPRADAEPSGTTRETNGDSTSSLAANPSDGTDGDDGPASEDGAGSTVSAKRRVDRRTLLVAVGGVLTGLGAARVGEIAPRPEALAGVENDPTEIVPGVTEDGVVDPDALATAHESTLEMRPTRSTSRGMFATPNGPSARRCRSRSNWTPIELTSCTWR
ncbi:hypothetical protein ACFO5R_09410 [Halosolutus amylolyticus]|uniref:Uncharacterized protein n=1 Tax=Halosolutus amylolyticus TaxID=2932267 RepID=A0ABD5PQH3_9EURY|nr:hypothetical protein [Halosolutus amylolyticus]